MICPHIWFRLDGGPQVDLVRRGRNMATTFTGLCSHHDHQIFAPIENQELEVSTEQLFLLAYRAGYRELHATIEAAVRAQQRYMSRVEQGLDPRHSQSPLGLAATAHIANSYEMFTYKSRLDVAYAANAFSAVAHHVIRFVVENPTVAVCSVFSVDHIRVGDDVLRVHLNVLPLTKTETVVVFSTLRSDATHATAFLDRILNSHGVHQRYEISRLVLNSSENFAICPRYYDSWTQEKREAVRTYFTRTIMVSDLGYESPHLYLF